MQLTIRVWDNEKKRMSEPMYIAQPIVRWSDGDTDMPTLFAIARDERFDIMLFTGIRDKNRINIYDGDIVQDDTTIYKVAYNTQNTGFWIFPISSRINEDWVLYTLNTRPLGNGYSTHPDIEVIGNIFTNP